MRKIQRTKKENMHTKKDEVLSPGDHVTRFSFRSIDIMNLCIERPICIGLKTPIGVHDSFNTQ